MLKLFKSSSIQTFHDESEKLASIRLLGPILIIEIVGLLGMGILDAVAARQLRTFYVSLPLLILIIAGVWWLRRGILYPAQILIPLGPLLIRDYLTLDGVGIHDVSSLAFAAVIILAYLTLTKSLAIGFTALTIISTSLITLAEMNGMIPNAYFSQFTNLKDLVEVAVLLAGISAVMYLMIDRLNQSIRQAWDNEQKQIEVNRELQEERTMLETRVKERTQALERRTIQLRAARPNFSSLFFMAASAVLPRRTKCAVMMPNFCVCASPAGAPSKYTSASRRSKRQNSCRMPISCISSSGESSRRPSLGIKLWPSIR